MRRFMVGFLVLAQVGVVGVGGASQAAGPPYHATYHSTDCGLLPSPADPVSPGCRADASASLDGHLSAVAEAAPLQLGVSLVAPAREIRAHAAAGVVARIPIPSKTTELAVTVLLRLHDAESSWSRLLYDAVQSDPDAGPEMTAHAGVQARLQHDCVCPVALTNASQPIVDGNQTAGGTDLVMVLRGWNVPAGMLDLHTDVYAFAALSCTNRLYACVTDDLGHARAAIDATVVSVESAVIR